MNKMDLFLIAIVILAIFFFSFGMIISHSASPTITTISTSSTTTTALTTITTTIPQTTNTTYNTTAIDNYLSNASTQAIVNLTNVTVAPLNASELQGVIANLSSQTITTGFGIHRHITTLPSINYSIINTTLPYGNVANGTYYIPASTGDLYYVSEQPSQVIIYNVSIAKASAKDAISIAGYTISGQNVTEVIHPPIVSTLGINTIDISPQISSDVVGNNKLGYTYQLKENGNIVNSGNIINGSINKALNDYTLTANENFTIQFDSSGNNNYTSDDPTIIIIPTVIINYIPITLTNSQASALTANTQISVTVNALAYEPYEQSMLNNTEFFYANGTVANSWLEGNVLNETKTSLYTATNVIYWIRVPNANVFLGAGTSTNTIYLGFAGNTPSTANQLITGAIVGEAPQLTCTTPSNTVTGCAAGQYAKYDNGNTVFVQYNDFIGSTLSSAWKTTGSPSYTVANGLYSFATGSGYSTISLNGTGTTTYNAETNIFSELGYITGVVGDKYTFSIDGYSRNNAIAIGMPPSGTAYYNLLSYNSIAGSSQTPYIPNILGSNVIRVFSSYAASTGQNSSISYNPYQLYTPQYAQIAFISSYFNLQADSAGTANAFLQWQRISVLPPNNIMPSATFGSIANTPVITLTVSNSILDAGQYETLNGILTTPSTANYIYNFSVVNVISTTLTHNALYSNVIATSNTFTFQTTSADTFNSPEKANVIIIDGNNAMITSMYSTNIIINPALVSKVWTASNSLLNTGQFQTLTATITGGTSSYTYNFLIYNAMGTLVNSIVQSNSITSNSFTFQVEGGTGNYIANIIITDSASTATSVTNTLTFTVDNTLNANGATPALAVIDNGQSITLTSNPNGGTQPYTYQWYTGTSTCGSLVSISGAIASNYIASPTSNTYYCYKVTDLPGQSTTTSTPANVIVNPALVSTAWTVQVNPIAYNQHQLLTANIIGGTTTYTYNILVYNAIGSLVANQLVIGQSLTTNSFNFLINSIWGPGIYTANVFITDSAYSPETISNTLTFVVQSTTTSFSCNFAEKKLSLLNYTIYDNNGTTNTLILYATSINPFNISEAPNTTKLLQVLNSTPVPPTNVSETLYVPYNYSFRVYYPAGYSPRFIGLCIVGGGNGGTNNRQLPSSDGFPNIPIGLIIAAISVCLFLFSFTGIKRRDDGLVYVIIFRVMAFLVMFIAYSVLVSPQMITYPAYNAVQGSTVTTFQAYNVTATAPKGTQTIYGWIVLAYSIVVMGSLGIDVAYGFREKKG